jgi:hypothetical protein
MGERYGQLPSQLMREATTFDLFVFDASVGYRNLQDRRARGEKEEMSTEMLLAKLEKFNAGKDKDTK